MYVKEKLKAHQNICPFTPKVSGPTWGLFGYFHPHPISNCLASFSPCCILERLTPESFTFVRRSSGMTTEVASQGRLCCICDHHGEGKGMFSWPYFPPGAVWSRDRFSSLALNWHYDRGAHLNPQLAVMLGQSQAPCSSRAHIGSGMCSDTLPIPLQRSEHYVRFNTDLWRKRKHSMNLNSLCGSEDAILTWS